MYSKISTIILIVIIPVLLAVFFIFSLYFFPHFYLATRQASQALPKIVNVNISTSSSLSDSGFLHLGESFVVTITSANLGDTADFQITSVSFPNITSDIHDNITNKIASVLHHNFTQRPVFIPIGNEIGSEYTGLIKTTTAKYPSIEFYNSPWPINTLYEAEIQVKPVSEGDFVIFVKVVALPHTTDLSHYPAVGIRDQQQEYVNVYHVPVVK
jgi:hypothetical protein